MTDTETLIERLGRASESMMGGSPWPEPEAVALFAEAAAALAAEKERADMTEERRDVAAQEAKFQYDRAEAAEAQVAALQDKLDYTLAWFNISREALDQALGPRRQDQP